MFDLVNLLSRLFSHVCHQIPDRSFNFLVFGGNSILCARCAGMYSGLLFGITLAVLAPKVRNSLIIKLLIVSVVFLCTEITVENIIVFAFGNIARFVTGIVFGVSVGIGMMAPVKLMYGGCK